MAVKKPKIVIIGAGMAGLTAANKLYTSTASADIFDLSVVEGGRRIGGRIHTSEFSSDRIELGATWIHGIDGSPVHQIAQQIKSLESEQNWECMDGFLGNHRTVLEGGLELNSPIVDSVSTLFNNLMDFAQGKSVQSDENRVDSRLFRELAAKSSNGGAAGALSVGEFLRRGLDAYWESAEAEEQVKNSNFQSRKLIEEAIFAMEENIQRTCTSAGDLLTLDFEAEREYKMFLGEEITIAKGYSSIIEALASKLPKGLIQLGRKVTKIEWQNQFGAEFLENGYVRSNKPVKLHFSDGSITFADHVIVTVSLGVLKAGIGENSGFFSPPLPLFKTEAISRLGFGVVNKLFLHLDTQNGLKNSDFKFPSLQMAFHRLDSEFRNKNVPWWMRRTASISPIYKNSSALLSWFAGKEALELESLDDEEIISGVSTTISTFINQKPNANNPIRFKKVLKSKWGNDPLFLGSYSYVAVGSSGDDMDLLAEPLPKIETFGSKTRNPLQILFAGEATHRTHYSTTHGAYFSGLREANRLLERYHCFGG